jgi:ribosomal protein L13E
MKFGEWSITVRLTTSFQMSQRPPDCPSAGTTKASEALKRLMREVRVIVELRVSEIKANLRVGRGHQASEVKEPPT